jgi:putative FmdB family regulatory protein
MPLYEFDCPDCGKPFERLVRSAAAVSEVVCPSCGSPRVRKRLSLFATRTGGSSSDGWSAQAASCSSGST